MGAWFSKFFMDKGYEVVISGRDMKKCNELRRKIGVEVAKNNIQAVKDADIVMIAVMIDRFEPVVKQIAPYLKRNQKVMDISSVKELPVSVMHRRLKGVTVLGTHPMFGPNAEPSGQNFILTPTNARERKYAKEFGRFLQSSGFRVRYVSPKKHDELIGVVLSLTHFVGFVTGDTWRKLRVDKVMWLSSTSFKFLRAFVKSIVDSNPELYSYLQMNVPNVKNAEEVFISSSKKWADMAKNKKRKEFINEMVQLKKYLDRLE